MKSGWRFSEMHEMNMNIASIHTHRSMHAHCRERVCEKMRWILHRINM